MHLTFNYVILLNQTGTFDVSNVSIGAHINYKRLFPSLALLFNLSPLGVTTEIEIYSCQTSAKVQDRQSL